MEIKKNLKIENFIKILFYISLAVGICLSIINLIFLLIGIQFSSIVELFIIFSLVYLLPSFFIFFIYKKTKNKSKKVKIISLFISIALFLGILFIDYVGFFMSIFAIGTAQTSYESHLAFRNKYYISLLVNEDHSYQIEHFPINIPKNAKNYYFSKEDDWHGEGTDYIKFNTDKTTIQNIIDYNKNKIYKKINYSKINDYYAFLDDFGINKDKEKYDVYILKQQKNDSKYTSGFIISIENNFILFFHQSFNSKQFDAKF